MARKRTAPEKKEKKEPELLFEDGYYWIVYGNGKRTNAGRSERYARNMLAEIVEERA